MMLCTLIFTVLTGFSFALISVIVSRIVRDRISFFQLYVLSVFRILPFEKKKIRRQPSSE